MNKWVGSAVWLCRKLLRKMTMMMLTRHHILREYPDRLQDLLRPDYLEVFMDRRWEDLRHHLLDYQEDRQDYQDYLGPERDRHRQEDRLHRLLGYQEDRQDYLDYLDYLEVLLVRHRLEDLRCHRQEDHRHRQEDHRLPLQVVRRRHLHCSVDLHRLRVLQDHQEDCRPHQEDCRPHQEDCRPHQEDCRPHQEDRRPHQEDRHPHQEDRRPHQEDLHRVLEDRQRHHQEDLHRAQEDRQRALEDRLHHPPQHLDLLGRQG
jgi:hypothetical protein